MYSLILFVLRFLEKVSVESEKFSYVPFGAGMFRWWPLALIISSSSIDHGHKSMYHSSSFRASSVYW